MILTIALSYGYAIRALPVTGGGVAFALAALGKVHALIAGWALTLAYSCIVALNASAVALVFRVTFPGLFMQMPLYDVAGWTIYLPEVILSSAFLIAFALLNIRGNAFSGRFQVIAVVLMLLSVTTTVVVLGVYYLIHRPAMAPGFPTGVSPVAATLAIVAFAPWAYVGFDSIPQLAGEFNFSPKKALGLLIWGVVAATFIYMAMMVTTCIAIGDNYDAYAGESWPPAVAIKEVMGSWGLVLMVIGVATGVLTGLNGFYAGSSRVLYTLGRSEMIPSFFGKIDSRYLSPRNAVIFVAAVCLITPWFGRAALLWIVDMSSVGVTVAYFYTSYCTWKIAGGHGQVHAVAPDYPKSKVYEIFGLVGCILSVAFIALLFIPGSPGMLGPQSLAALCVWLVLGIFFYLLRRDKLVERENDPIYEQILAKN